jgi:hypothetical protein
MWLEDTIIRLARGTSRTTTLPLPR